MKKTVFFLFFTIDYYNKYPIYCLYLSLDSKLPPLIEWYAEVKGFFFAMIKTAILVDGAFFLKRYKFLSLGSDDPEKVADDLYIICHKHLTNQKQKAEPKQGYP